MNEKALFFAIFNIIEFITEAELTTTSRKLVINYYEESAEETIAGKARAAAIRYTQCGALPLLEDIRKKRVPELSKLEHLVLKMEYEAKKLEVTEG